MKTIQLMDEGSENQGKVVFQESNWSRRSYEPEKKTPRMIDWVINHSGGRITEPSQAGAVLVGFIILALLATFILFSSGGSNTEPPREALKNPKYGLPERD